MPRVTNKDVLMHFYETFGINVKALTKSQHAVNGARLKNLRKLVDEYVENNNISTEKSTNEIIMQCIDYSKMVGKNFKSISSLGYDTLPKSILYWSKKESQQSKPKPQESEELTNDKLDQQIAKNNEQLSNTRKTLKWLEDDSEEYY